MSLPEQFKRNTDVSLIVSFVLLLWLPTLDLFFHLDRSPMPNENRALANFPTLVASSAGVNAFPTGLEAYFRDHFGFRNRLIRWESHWKHDLFKASNTAEVISGQSGWLFYAGGYMMENFQGLRRFSPQQLRDWQTLLEKRRDWLASRGITYLFVIPPDKHYIYPEYLPAWLSHRGATNQLDQFLAYMHEHSTVAILDLRPALLAGKKTGYTYLQTDTHWNFFGAFLGYQAIVQALGRQLPAVGEPLPLSAFDRHPVPQNENDLARMFGQGNRLVESNQIAFSPRPPLRQPVLKFEPDRLPNKWHPATEPLVTESAATLPKAILFRDSFANNLAEFLGYHFHEVIYIWHYHWDAAFIEREKPTVVIDEILEHYFETEHPLELLRQDALP